MSPPKPAKCMKCDRPATYRITKILKGKVFDILLCAEHAQAYSPHLQKPDSSKLMELLQQFFKEQQEAGAVQEGEETSPVCSNCGLSFEAYRKTLLLGCSECYQSFERLLVPDLRKIHGATSHDPETASRPAGEAPATQVFPQTEKTIPMLKVETEEEDESIPSIATLRDEMREAIAHEDFELAAQLRDRIRDIKETQQTENE
ncbi:UvrB/UvrC motif-containing protein [Candidatus Sumerlaeota bacterium]|nr:UvrB/UvrC motif-containing protein [Candidatus Sumerlaeota bacterium]